MMFYVAWIILIITGVGGSIITLLWALRSGQFADQGRARYLPLRDDFPLPAVKDPAKLTPEVWVLLIVIGIGLLSLAGTLALTVASIFRQGVG